MTKNKNSNKTNRLPLSREKILSTTLEIADKYGLNSITMRNLAKKLGVEAMSLYKHIANKDELLDGIVDIVISEIYIPSDNLNWKTQMKMRAISARKIFSQHPWAPALFESRTNASLTMLVYAEKILSIIRNHGYSISKALQIFLTVDSYIYGFILQESNWQFDNKERMANNEFQNFPYLKELMAHFEKRKKKMSQKEMLDKEFEIGLDLILQGFQKK